MDNKSTLDVRELVGCLYRRVHMHESVEKKNDVFQCGCEYSCKKLYQEYGQYCCGINLQEEGKILQRHCPNQIEDFCLLYNYFAETQNVAMKLFSKTNPSSYERSSQNVSIKAPAPTIDNIRSILGGLKNLLIEERKDITLNLSGAFIYMVYHQKDVSLQDLGGLFNDCLVLAIEHNEKSTYQSRYANFINSEHLTSSPARPFHIHDLIQIISRKLPKDDETLLSGEEKLTKVLTTGIGGRVFSTFLKSEYDNNLILSAMLSPEEKKVYELLQKHHYSINQHMKEMKERLQNLPNSIAKFQTHNTINYETFFSNLKRWNAIDLLFYDFFIDRINITIKNNEYANNESNWKSNVHTLHTSYFNLFRNLFSDDDSVNKLIDDLISFSAWNHVVKVCGHAEKVTDKLFVVLCGCVNKVEDILSTIRERQFDTTVKPFVRSLLRCENFRKVVCGKIKDTNKMQQDNLKSIFSQIEWDRVPPCSHQVLSHCGNKAKTPDVIKRFFNKLMPKYFNYIDNLYRKRLLFEKLNDLVNSNIADRKTEIISVILQCMGPVARRIFGSLSFVAVHSFNEDISGKEILINPSANEYINHHLNYNILCWRQFDSIEKGKLEECHFKSSQLHDYYRVVDDAKSVMKIIKIVKLNMKSEVMKEINIFKKIMQINPECFETNSSATNDFIAESLSQMCNELDMNVERENIRKLHIDYDSEDSNVHVVDFSDSGDEYVIITEETLGDALVPTDPPISYEILVNRHKALQKFYENWLKTVVDKGLFHARLNEENVLFQNVSSTSYVKCTIRNFESCFQLLEDNKNKPVLELIDGLHHFNADKIISSLRILSRCPHTSDSGQMFYTECKNIVNSFKFEEQSGLLKECMQYRTQHALLTEILHTAASCEQVFSIPFYEFMHCMKFLDKQMELSLKSLQKVGHDTNHDWLRGKDDIVDGDNGILPKSPLFQFYHEKVSTGCLLS